MHSLENFNTAFCAPDDACASCSPVEPLTARNSASYTGRPSALNVGAVECSYAARQSARSNVTTPIRGCVIAAQRASEPQRLSTQWLRTRYDASSAPTRSSESWL